MSRENGPLFGARISEVNAVRVRKDLRVLQIVLSFAIKVRNIRSAPQQPHAAGTALQSKPGSDTSDIGAGIKVWKRTKCRY